MDFAVLGSQIRKYRHKRNLTQAKLAEIIGVSTSFIGHIERGTRVLSMETFVLLCAALDTDPNTLLSANINLNSFSETLNDQQKHQLRQLLQYGVQMIEEGSSC